MLTFAIIIGILFLLSWFYLLWETVKNNSDGWSCLCAIGASMCSFMVGVAIMRIFELI